MSPSDWKVSNVLLGKCGETVLKRMKSLGQSRNDAQLWIFHGGESKVWYCKEHYYIWTWNVRSMNKGELDIIKQDMARVSIDMLGIFECKWTGLGTFYSDDHYMCYSEGNRQEGWSEVKSLSRVRLFATPWTVAYQAPPSMGFSRQEYWSGL